MNWALEALGVEPGADERAIKRAYARLLRDNRPEDDPQAFQRLHEAYQTALQWHRHQQVFADAQEQDAGVGDAGWTFAVEDSTAHASPAPPEEQTDIAAQVIAPEIVSTPTEPVADSLAFAADGFVMPPAVDMDALVERIVESAANLPPDGFDAWLNHCPELWSLNAKADAGNALLGRLYHGEDAVGGANFDRLTAAFGWDEVGTHVDPDTLAGMREALRQRWIWQAGNEPALALELQVDQDAPATLPETRRCRTLLTRPWRHWQALFSAVNPSRLQMMRNALQHTDAGWASLPSPPLREEQVHFWRNVTDENGLHRDRVLLGLLRGLCLTALWLLLPLAAYLMKASTDLNEGLGWPSPGDLVPLALAGTAFMLLFGMGVLPWKLLLRWLGNPTAVRLWLPLMAIAAIMLGPTQLEFLGTVLGGGALWIGVRRALRGSPRLNQMLPVLAIGIFFAAPFVMQSMRLSYGALTGGLTLMLCVYELGSAYRNRRLQA